MKLLAVVSIVLAVGISVCSAGNIRLQFSPERYSVVEGGVYEVCLVITEGTATEDKSFIIKASYERGKETGYDYCWLKKERE